ncbi:hypothetical protein DVH24_006749 [Malus domestica]|uniref:Uncharacterized protein n=1 Tax=Malus domestica TaxID=3750 RepID=A0A498KIU1_MALDO|nr:hypothetical protein DVH24_006749 [Malus domestica]
MWDRFSVDLGTINAKSLKLSNSNPGFQPFQLLRVRTPASTTNSSKMPSSLKSAGVGNASILYLSCFWDDLISSNPCMHPHLYFKNQAKEGGRTMVSSRSISSKNLLQYI